MATVMIGCFNQNQDAVDYITENGIYFLTTDTTTILMAKLQAICVRNESEPMVHEHGCWDEDECVFLSDPAAIYRLADDCSADVMAM